MYTWDAQCFGSLGCGRKIHNSFDDVHDGALRVLSNGIKLPANGLASVEM
jgi:hypothetical protein